MGYSGRWIYRNTRGTYTSKGSVGIEYRYRDVVRYTILPSILLVLHLYPIYLPVPYLPY